MTAPSVSAFGRGAWSSLGHTCGGPYYRKSLNKPADGSYPTPHGSEHEAIRLGVKAIQTEVNKMGVTPPLTVDGLFGSGTTVGVKWAQTKLGVSADGIVGAGTCKRLWRRAILFAADQYDVDPSILYGQASHESSFDPGAVGYYHPADRGLIQINTEVYTSITVEQAHDTAFALDWSAKRLASAAAKYKGKGTELQISCMVLQHNNPSGADYLYQTGSYRSILDHDYVEAIKLAYQDW